MSKEPSLEGPGGQPGAATLELELKEAELALKRAELTAKSAARPQRWANPLVIAVLTAAAAAAGNAVVAYVNGMQQRGIERERAEGSIALERAKAEAAQVLEAIKTGDPDTAADNLRLLLEAGLLSDPDRVAGVSRYLAARQPGEGASLPAPGGGASQGAPSRLQDLPADHPARGFAPAIALFMRGKSGLCTASLLAPDIVLTMSFCLDASSVSGQSYRVVFLPLSSGQSLVERDVVMPPLVLRKGWSSTDTNLSKAEFLAGDVDFVLLRLAERVEPDRVPLQLAREPPGPGTQARLLMHHGGAQVFVTEGVSCTVEEVAAMRLRHACASDAGSAGGPIIAGDGRTIGFEFAGNGVGFAIRADRIAGLPEVEAVLANP